MLLGQPMFDFVRLKPLFKSLFGIAGGPYQFIGQPPNHDLWHNSPATIYSFVLGNQASFFQIVEFGSEVFEGLDEGFEGKGLLLQHLRTATDRDRGKSLPSFRRPGFPSIQKMPIMFAVEAIKHGFSALGRGFNLVFVGVPEGGSGGLEEVGMTTGQLLNHDAVLGGEAIASPVKEFIDIFLGEGAKGDFGEDVEEGGACGVEVLGGVVEDMDGLTTGDDEGK